MGENVMVESFHTYREAFEYLTGYIGAAPILIEEMETN
jgi:hypothetical protein